MKSKTHRKAKSTLNERLCLQGIAIAYLVLALCYLVRIPVGRQPDEASHLQYIEHLAEKHRFPVFQGREAGIYEAHQPPLYYLLCVPSYWLLQSVSPNAPAYAARLLSLIAGLGIVCLTWRMAGRVATNRSGIPLIASGFVALLPMHLNVSASVSNDALGGLICVLVLTLLLDELPQSRVGKRCLWTGALIGLGLLAKSSCVLLLPLTAFVLLLRNGVQACGLKKTLPQFSLVLAASLVVSGFWLARNTHLYGDPFAVRAFNEGFNSSPHPSFFLDRGMSSSAYLLMVAQLTFMTFWGIFGEVNQSISRLALMYASGEGALIYALLVTSFASITTLSLIGLLRVIRTLTNHPLRDGGQLDKTNLWALVVGTFLVLMQFVQFNATYFQAQARYLHPMLGAIACLWAVGAENLPGERLRRTLVVWLGVGMLVSSVCNLSVWLQPVQALPK